MNQVNFNPLDFSNGMNRRQDDWNQFLNSVSGIGNALNTYSDRKAAEDEKKRKWDSILELERKGQEALDAEQNYNDSIARQNELRGCLKTAQDINASNKRYRSELEGLRQDGYVQNDSGNDLAFDESTGTYVMTRPDGSRSFYGKEGIKEGLWSGDGLRYVDGASPQNQERIKELQGKIRADIPTDGLNWKLEQERANGLRYQKAGQMADMYRDPRYKAALESAKAANDPTAIYQYMNQWISEEPYRQRQETMRNLDGLQIGDMSSYGQMAVAAKQGFENARSPEEKQYFLSMLNGIVSQRDQYNLAEEQRRREENLNNEFALAIDKYNRTDWSKAGLFDKMNRTGFDPRAENNPRTIRMIQKNFLGTNVTGSWSRKDQDAYDLLKKAYDEQNTVRSNLINKYGGARFLSAFNDSLYQKRLMDLYNSNVHRGRGGSGF